MQPPPLSSCCPSPGVHAPSPPLPAPLCLPANYFLVSFQGPQPSVLDALVLPVQTGFPCSHSRAKVWGMLSTADLGIALTGQGAQLPTLCKDFNCSSSGEGDQQNLLAEPLPCSLHTGIAASVTCSTTGMGAMPKGLDFGT